MDNTNDDFLDRTAPTGSPYAGSKGFLRPFGKTALWLGVASIAVPWIFSIGINAAMKTSQSRQDGTDIAIVSILTMVLAAVFGIGALVLGLLALCGFGKQEGSSHRIAGFFGLLIGGGMVAIWSVLPFAVIAARKATMAKAEQAQQGELMPYQHLETGSQFSKPNDGWILQVGNEAKKTNSESVAVITKKTTNPNAERMGILIVERLEHIKTAEDLDFQATATAIADGMSMSDKSIESIEIVNFDGHPAAKLVICGLPPGSARIRYSNLFCFVDGYLFQILALGLEGGSTIDDPDFTLIHNALKLPPKRVMDSVPDEP